MTFYSFNPLNVNSLECVLMNNQECKIRTKLIEISSNESTFYPFSISVNKSSENCNNTNDRYAKLYVPDVVKNIKVKVFNLMSRANETRHIEWHKTCKCKCRLNSSVCNNKQRCKEFKECKGCKELIGKGRCDKGFIWNPSNFDCECDKSCDVEQYLDYKNWKCRKKIISELTEKCNENIDEDEIICNRTVNDYKKVCSSCALYIET